MCNLDSNRTAAAPAAGKGDWPDQRRVFPEEDEKQDEDDVAQASSSSSEEASLSHGNRRRQQLAAVTAKELASHHTPDDCWIAIKNKVYDITGWGSQHPGGNVVYAYGGQDATDVFSTFHAAITWQQLSRFCIGQLQVDTPTPALLEDYRRLRAKFQADGLFTSNKYYYVFKVLCNLGILYAAFGALRAAAHSALFLILSAALLSICWQQCGWLAHDFLHHQVFRHRALNNLAGLLIGNLWQGLSVTWWKTKHNTHHAVPNECDHAFAPIDPDIDTLPLLAWSKEMLLPVSNPIHRILIRHQQLLVWPLLCIARTVWLIKSILFVIKPVNAKYATSLTPLQAMLELSCLGLHWSWYLWAAFSHLGLIRGALYVALTQLASGFLLSFVFVQSHNGMEVYNDRHKDFVSKQVVSTRDIQSSLLNDWFTGGLNRQIEHHLFPTMPRHNLGCIAPAVKALCERHGLVYEDASFAEGTAKVLERLAEVAREA
eukprot:jgi/Chlat1/1538/Chrsp122S00078